MAKISFLPDAEQDYQESLAWFYDRSSQAAAGFEAAMEVALQRILNSPEMSPLCDYRHRFYLMRRYPFSIIYRIDADAVLVVAVTHARRSSSYWQGRVRLKNQDSDHRSENINTDDGGKLENDLLHHPGSQRGRVDRPHPFGNT
jgi:plasmid stabilization system protein ParE